VVINWISERQDNLGLVFPAGYSSQPQLTATNGNKPQLKRPNLQKQKQTNQENPIDNINGN